MGPEPSENYSMVLIPVQDHGCKLGSYQAVTTTATTKKINLRVENERWQGASKDTGEVDKSYPDTAMHHLHKDAKGKLYQEDHQQMLQLSMN